ncbi:MAG TPA: family 1 encapsulin nanocompartment shell protein [Acidimicrobiales bacterium]|nr:family 1 encapsulin nanocompartment shell protein [Acidimicrobiales bacterium]
MTDHLRRALAPVSDAAWEQIDNEASRTLRHFLAARALVDFTGPKGWDYSGETVGRTSAPTVGDGGVTSAVRVPQPMVELRKPFELSLAELDRADRGAEDVDLAQVVSAAREAALAEDRAVFDGLAAGGISGIATGSAHDPLPIGDDYGQYPGVVARAVATLRREGIGGPYAIALGPRCYTGVIETTEYGGYPVLEHMKLILGGPVVWAPGVDGAVVVSTRGGDFELVCGQDFSIGFRRQVEDTVELYLEESFTFKVNEPRAGIALRYPT